MKGETYESIVFSVPVGPLGSKECMHAVRPHCKSRWSDIASPHQFLIPQSTCDGPCYAQRCIGCAYEEVPGSLLFCIRDLFPKPAVLPPAICWPLSMPNFRSQIHSIPLPLPLLFDRNLNEVMRPAPKRWIALALKVWWRKRAISRSNLPYLGMRGSSYVDYLIPCFSLELHGESRKTINQVALGHINHSQSFQNRGHPRASLYWGRTGHQNQNFGNGHFIIWSW